MHPQNKSFNAVKSNKMVTELLVVWIVGVVAFFALWAILLKVIKRISERKHKDDAACEDADPMEATPKQLD